jgi:exodeoxyribonuclease V alpha subunit
VVLTVHGGMKTYRGSAAGARNYLKADRSRADDYYLADGAGVAERFVASPDGWRAGDVAADRRRV